MALEIIEINTESVLEDVELLAMRELIRTKRDAVILEANVYYKVSLSMERGSEKEDFLVQLNNPVRLINPLHITPDSQQHLSQMDTISGDNSIYPGSIYPVKINGNIEFSCVVMPILKTLQNGVRKYGVTNENAGENDIDIIYEGVNSKVTRYIPLHQNESDHLTEQSQLVKIIELHGPHEYESYRRERYFSELVDRELGYLNIHSEAELIINDDVRIVYLIQTRLPKITLLTFLETCPLLTREQTLNLCIRLCGSLYSIHKLNIIIRDLKPENIIINFDDLLLNFITHIIDFGLAKFKNEIIQESAGTREYVSPENYFHYDKGTDESTDIYSLGKIFAHIAEKMADKTDKLYTELVQLSNEMLNADYLLRPTLNQILKHLYFQSEFVALDSHAYHNLLTKMAPSDSTDIPILKQNIYFAIQEAQNANIPFDTFKKRLTSRSCFDPVKNEYKEYPSYQQFLFFNQSPIILRDCRSYEKLQSVLQSGFNSIENHDQSKERYRGILCDFYVMLNDGSAISHEIQDKYNALKRMFTQFENITTTPLSIEQVINCYETELKFSSLQTELIELLSQNNRSTLGLTSNRAD